MALKLKKKLVINEITTWINPKQYISFFLKVYLSIILLKEANKFSILFYLFSIFFFTLDTTKHFFYVLLQQKGLPKPFSPQVNWLHGKKSPWMPLWYVQICR